MYKEWSSILRKGQKPIAPKRDHVLFELFLISGDIPRVARPEAVCVWGWRGLEGRVVCTEANGIPGLNTSVNGSVAVVQNTFLCCRNKWWIWQFFCRCSCQKQHYM